VLISLNRRQTAKEILHRKNYSHDHSMVLTDHEGSPCETSIQGGGHLNGAEKGSHHIWISSPELQGLNDYHIKDLIHSALAHLRDDNQAQLPEVEKTVYAATDEAWNEYEAKDTPFPSLVIYPPRGAIMLAFELLDVYKPHRPSPVGRLELVSAQ
jgi:hypothetical protein